MHRLPSQLSQAKVPVNLVTCEVHFAAVVHQDTMAVWVILQLVALAALTSFIVSNLKRFRPKNFPPGEINQELAGMGKQFY